MIQLQTVLRISAITVVFLGLKFFPSMCRCVFIMYQSYIEIYYEIDIRLKTCQVTCFILKLQFLTRLMVIISKDYLFIPQLTSSTHYIEGMVIIVIKMKR